MEEVVEGNHVTAHVVSPFQDLRTDVSKEGIRGPAAQDHDAGDRVVVEEERHGGTRADGLGPNVGGTVSQLGCPAKVGTCLAKLLGQKLLGGLGANARNHGHVEGCARRDPLKRAPEARDDRGGGA